MSSKNKLKSKPKPAAPKKSLLSILESRGKVYDEKMRGPINPDLGAFTPEQVYDQHFNPHPDYGVPDTPLNSTTRGIPPNASQDFITPKGTNPSKLRQALEQYGLPRSAIMPGLQRGHVNMKDGTQHPVAEPHPNVRPKNAEQLPGKEFLKQLMINLKRGSFI